MKRTVFGLEYIVARADADEMARNNNAFFHEII